MEGLAAYVQLDFRLLMDQWLLSPLSIFERECLQELLYACSTIEYSCLQRWKLIFFVYRSLDQEWAILKELYPRSSSIPGPQSSALYCGSWGKDMNCCGHKVDCGMLCFQKPFSIIFLVPHALLEPCHFLWRDRVYFIPWTWAGLCTD